MRVIVFEKESISLTTMVTTIVVNNEREIILNTIRVANPEIAINQGIPVLPSTYMEGLSTWLRYHLL